MKDIKDVTGDTNTEINSYIKDLKLYLRYCKNSSKFQILKNIKNAELHKKDI